MPGLFIISNPPSSPNACKSIAALPGAETMNREFLKDSVRKTADFSKTDQNRGLPPPPVQKPVPDDVKIIPLPRPEKLKSIPRTYLRMAIANRKSRRSFLEESISLEELSFLLWACQGVRKKESEVRVYRNVPSAGCRHPLETYIAIFRVVGLEKGLYRYLPLDHALVLVSKPRSLEKKVAGACMGQTFAGTGAATFIWATIPYRMEWRYGAASYKVIGLDAGHACQNLYLACESIGCGTCAIAAYDQALTDMLLGVDGDDEFVIYIAPVGRVKD